jgi:hypothetical protein
VQRIALIALAVAALAAPAKARAVPVFVFDQPSASPNDRVTVRTAGRVEPLQQRVRIYLVRADIASEVRSRLDRRVNFIGSVVPDRNGRGVLTFSVPPLDSGEYTLAYWYGRTFAVQQRAQLVQRFRSRALLRIDTTQPCPVTLPNANRPPGQPPISWYGNGLLWAGLTTNGIYAVPQDRVDPDGSIFNKLLWATSPPESRPTVSGERLDAPAPPLHVRAVNQGSFSSAQKPSYMSAVSFPTAGCWRLKARVADVSLTYVVEVVVGAPPTP